MEKKDTIKKRLSMFLDINVHCEVKKRAAIRNITMTDWIMMAIMQRIEYERKYE